MSIPLQLALIDQDRAVMTLSVFGAATVVPTPGKIEASGGAGKAKATGRAVCVRGDEMSVEMRGCTYMAPPFVIPGVGTAKIHQLAPDQIADKTQVNGKAVLMKGTLYEMKFEVQSPAMMPPPVSIPDPTPLYFGGKGQFIPANNRFFAK